MAMASEYGRTMSHEEMEDYLARSENYLKSWVPRTLGDIREDLLQEVRISLVRYPYDPKRGVKFGTYVIRMVKYVLGKFYADGRVGNAVPNRLPLREDPEEFAVEDVLPDPEAQTAFGRVEGEVVIDGLPATAANVARMLCAGFRAGEIRSQLGLSAWYYAQAKDTLEALCTE